ncbi:MAG: YlmC/YmxH family sporulation protein [Clostridiaceae bacterium]
MFSINNLKTMEVIDINTGTKLGYIRDFVIDTSEYLIKSIIIPSNNVSFFGKVSNIEIPWSKIEKVGNDVVLVDGSELIEDINE